MDSIGSLWQARWMATAPIHPAYDVVIKRPWHRCGVTLLSAVILVVLAGWVAGVPALFPPGGDKTAQTKRTTSTSATASRPVNSAGIVAPPPVGNDSSVSSVSLPLILTGTMPGRNPREGQVFIGVNRGSPQTYAAGALLANNSRIAEIYTDHVVLEREGQRVDLYLEGTGHHTESKRLAGLLTVGGTTAPPPATVTSHEVLTDYLRPSPVYDGQLLKGYQVHAGQNAGVFFQMGLQAGDVITTINGVPLSEANSAIEQLQQLVRGYAVTAVIDRNGKIETLSLDGALIARDQQRRQNTPIASEMSMPDT